MRSKKNNELKTINDKLIQKMIETINKAVLESLKNLLD